MELKLPKPLRLWPGVVAVVLVCVARFGVKAVVPGFTGFALGMQWTFPAMALVVVWWALFSRARWFERLSIIVLMIAGARRRMGPQTRIDGAALVVCLRAPRPLRRTGRRRRCYTSLPGSPPARSDGGRRPVRMRSVDARPDRTASAATTSRSSVGGGRRAPRNVFSSRLASSNAPLRPTKFPRRGPLLRHLRQFRPW